MLAIVACTAFVLGQGNDIVVGKSYDWHLSDAIVIVNKRGVEKRALTVRPGEKPAIWVSKYGSITFNQYGRELPNGGMNEAGLVVEVLWLDETRYAAPDDRPAVGELQWIQMQLDRYATAAEVAASVDETRITSDNAKVHYLACDRSGACVVVEVLDGKAVASPGAHVLTNDTYAASVKYASGRESVPMGSSSLERFARATAMTRTAAEKKPVAAAFGVLVSVAQGDYSKWNIVYEPVHGRVSWRTRTNVDVRSLEIGTFDLSCGSTVTMVGIDEPASRMRAYEREANRAVVARSLADMKLPSALATLVSSYPETLRCAR